MPHAYSSSATASSEQVCESAVDCPQPSHPSLAAEATREEETAPLYGTIQRGRTRQPSADRRLPTQQQV